MTLPWRQYPSFTSWGTYRHDHQLDLHLASCAELAEEVPAQQHETEISAGADAVDHGV